MKITIFLLTVVCLQVAVAGQAQTVTYSGKNVPLEKVIAAIKKQTGYMFLYPKQVLKDAKPVNIEAKQLPLRAFLDLLFKGQPIRYMIKSNSIILSNANEAASATSPVPVGENAPNTVFTTVTGKVLNQEREPLVGATILNKTSKISITAGQEGRFSIDANQGDMLDVSFVGYQTFSVQVTKNNHLVVALQRTVDALDDVTVTVSTGYQDIPKERVTGSFVKLENSLINRSVSTNILNRLEGVTSGLLFNRNVNAVNNPNGVDMSIRGTSTLLSYNQPLIIVDNFPYDGNIANINPNDVESITVLKDAAAASIWGAFSGNGVIVITTKKGKVNQKLSVDVNANVTVGKKPDLFYNPNTLNSNDFIDLEIELFKRGFYNNDLITAGRPTVSPVVALLDKFKRNQIDSLTAYGKINSYRGLDVRDDMEKYLLQKSVAQQYSIGIRGGSANSDYFLSVGYDNNRASYVGNENNRITINSMTNFYLSKKLQLTAGFNYIQATTTTNNNMSDVRVGGTRLNIYPYAQLADASGNPLIIPKDYNNDYKDTVGSGKLTNWSYAPLKDLGLVDNKNKLFDNRLNVGLKYNVLSNLNLEVKYQYERANTTATNYYNDSSYYVRNLYNRYTNLATGAHPVPLGGILYSNNYVLTSHRARTQLNYSLNKNPKHNLAAIAGAEISQAVTEGNSNTAYGYNKDTKSSQLVDYLTFFATNPSSSSQKIPGSFGFSRYTDRYISYFGNGAYTYLGKYTLSLSGRIDKSNLFGVNTNQKSVPLYSAGIRWNIAKEKFYGLDWLPYSNIRVTYGYNGNVNKRLTAVTTIRELSNATYSGIPYSLIANPGNPELRWEKVRIINFGYDFSFKSQVISGTLEYYIKRGIDLIGDSPLPPSVGLSTFTGNTADTKGQGFDITVNTNNINSQHFKWQTTILVSYIKDIVKRYHVKSTADNYIVFGSNNGGGAIYPLEGKPLYAMYSYSWAGLDPNTGNPLGYVGKTPSADYNAIIANTTIDSMLFNGTSRPTTFGSVRNSFSYRRLAVSFNIVFKCNYYFRRSSVDYDGLFGTWSGHKDYENRWQKPGDEAHTNVPSLVYPPVTSNRGMFYAYSAALIEKGDHIRLQDISISYDLDNMFRKAISRLQVYAYINNVGLIWKANKAGLDPDVYSTGLPAATTFSFGVKAGF